VKEITKTSRLAGQLEKLFNMLNADLFNNELATPIITIQSTPRAYGHYSLNPLWQVKGDVRHEINIGAGTLDRPIENIVGTMVHEMCHMYDDTVLNIQDCSRGGTYHNRAFARTAAGHGLIVSRSEKFGWSRTEPSDELIEWILENNISEIKLNRNEPNGIRIGGGTTAVSGGAITGTARRGNSIRWVCPKCGMIARTTRAAFLVCGECLEIMREE